MRDAGVVHRGAALWVRRARVGVQFIALYCALCSPWVLAAEESAATPASPIYPAPVRTFDVEGGYRYFQDSSLEDESFYRVSYRGQLVDSRGEPLKSAEHLDLTVPAPAATQGDRESLVLTLENRNATLGGGLFELDGAAPLRLRGLAHLNLRGAAYVASDLDGSRTKVSLGLESPPLRIPGAMRLNAANYLLFGVMMERDDATDSAEQDSEYALATGRFFIGKAFGMHRRPQRDAIARAIADEVLRLAPTRAQAAAVTTPLRSVAPEDLTDLQSWLLDLIDDTDGGTDWQAAVLGSADQIADAVSEQPTFAAYLEGSGWYAGKARPDEPRRRGLLSLTLDYWPLLSRNDVILRARYEWGFERLQPRLRINQLTISVALQF